MKCPNCKSSNVYTSKRGFSVLIAICAVVVADLWILIHYAVSLSNAGLQATTFTGACCLFDFIVFDPIVFIVAGMIGKNRLVHQCLDCGRKFDKYAVIQDKSDVVDITDSEKN